MSISRSSTVVRDIQALFDVGVTGTLTDGQLLDRFVERREGAVFEALVHRHGPMVWGICRRILRDHQDAEDAFQATFLVLARKASTVMPRDKLGNWLYGVAYQTAIRARATRTKKRRREIRVTEMPEPKARSQDHRDDLLESLDRELSRLPEKYRIPIILCELEGKTHREAAARLGWPIGTVSGRLSRGRAMLARRLSRRGMSLSVGSLAMLLAQDAASASMPARLIVSTARAASLSAAGGAATAGVVSTEVAVLTGEVMKIMLTSKLKVGVAMLLALSVLAAGGIGLAYRAQATEPGQKEELQRLIGEKQVLQRLIHEKKEELQRLIATAGQGNELPPSDSSNRHGTKAPQFESDAVRKLNVWDERVRTVRTRFNEAEEQVRVADTNRRRAEAELQIAQDNLKRARAELEMAEDVRAKFESEARSEAKVSADRSAKSDDPLRP